MSANRIAGNSVVSPEAIRVVAPPHLLKIRQTFPNRVLAFNILQSLDHLILKLLLGCDTIELNYVKLQLEWAILALLPLNVFLSFFFLLWLTLPTIFMSQLSRRAYLATQSRDIKGGFEVVLKGS